MVNAIKWNDNSFTTSLKVNVQSDTNVYSAFSRMIKPDVLIDGVCVCVLPGPV